MASKSIKQSQPLNGSTKKYPTSSSTMNVNTGANSSGGSSKISQSSTVGKTTVKQPSSTMKVTTGISEKPLGRPSKSDMGKPCYIK